MRQRMSGRWRWAVLLAVLMAPAGGAAGWYAARPTWRAMATLQVQPMPDAVWAGDVSNDPAQMRQRVESLRQAAADAQRDVLRDDAVLRAALNGESAPTAWGGADERARPRTIEAYRQGLTLDVPAGGRGRVVLSYTHSDPNAAEAGARAAVAAVRDAFVQWQRPVAQQLERLGVRDLASRRQAAEARLAELERDAPLIDAAAAREAQRLDATARELADVELALTRAEAQAQARRDERARFAGRAVAAWQRGAAGALMRRLLGDASAATSTADTVDATPRTPVPGEASLPDAELDREGLDTLRGRQQRLIALRDRFAASVAAFHDRQAELERVRAAATQLAAQDVQARELEMRARSAIDLAVVDEPAVGEVPVDDPRPVWAGIGAVGGGLLGLCIVPLLTLLDTRMRRASAADSGDPAAPLYGSVPVVQAGRQSHESDELTALAIHEIRAMLRIRARQGGGQAFAITSPSRGAGKTSLTVGLAHSLAMSGTRTLLVDCDLVGRMAREEEGAAAGGGAQPQADGDGVGEAVDGEGLKRQPQSLDEVMLQMGYLDADDAGLVLFADEREVGLTGMLAGEPLERCVVESRVANLSLLPAVAVEGGHVGRMSGEFVRSLIEQARPGYDMILFDTGPIPGSVEGMLVASEADGVVVVASRGESQRKFDRTLSHLRLVGATLTGTVFNRAAGGDVMVERSGTRRDRKDRPKQDQATQARRANAGSGILAAAVASQAGAVAKPRPRQLTSGTGQTEGAVKSVVRAGTHQDAAKRKGDPDRPTLADVGDLARELADDVDDLNQAHRGSEAGAAGSASDGARPEGMRDAVERLQTSLDRLVAATVALRRGPRDPGEARSPMDMPLTSPGPYGTTPGDRISDAEQSSFEEALDRLARGATQRGRDI